MKTMSQRHPIAVFSGTGNPALAEAIVQRLGIPLGGLRITRFPDSEVYVKFEESVRGSDVFLIQPTCAPIDGNLMELLIAIDALKRAAAYRITCVLPYYGYARSLQSSLLTFSALPVPTTLWQWTSTRMRFKVSSMSLSITSPRFQ